MISPDDDFSGAPLLRHEARLDGGHGDLVEASLRATAHGVFAAWINGAPVADDVLSPGWTSYEWRLRYRQYDVTELVRAASAEIDLPDGRRQRVTGGRRRLTSADAVSAPAGGGAE
jgi:hypothetical protein